MQLPRMQRRAFNDLFHAVLQQPALPSAQELFDFRVLLAQERLQPLLQMLDGVVEIDDLLATGEVDLAMIFKSPRAIDEKHNSLFYRDNAGEDANSQRCSQTN